MPSLVENQPRGFLRWGLRAPIWLYRAGLGWILGERFLMLSHIGRKSGLPRQTVIEVVRHDKTSGAYFVASGWGAKSDWFQNIQKNPEVKIKVGTRQMNVIVQLLSLEDASRELFIYARDHPAAFHELSQVLAGQALKGTEEECKQLARSIPVVAFRPKAKTDTGSQTESGKESRRTHP